MNVSNRLIFAILAMMLMVSLASCGTNTINQDKPSETVSSSQGTEEAIKPTVKETEAPVETTGEYDDLPTDENADRLNWIVNGTYGPVNMFLDFDGSVFWIYDNEKNERYTKMMQDYMENHTESEVAEYAISLGIDPSIYLGDSSGGSEAPAIANMTAFDEAQEWYYDLKVKLDESYANRTYRDQTTYRYDSWSNTVISEDQRIYNAMKPVEVEFNEYFMLEPGWYYTYYTDENGDMWQFWYGIQEPDDGKYVAIYSAAEDKHPEVHQGDYMFATVGITRPEFDWIKKYNVSDIAAIVDLAEETVSLTTCFSTNDGYYDVRYVDYDVHDGLIYYGPEVDFDNLGEIGRNIYTNSGQNN